MRLTKHELRDQVANLILDRMGSKGISRQTVAMGADCMVSTICTVLSGKWDVKLVTLVNILDALGLQLKVVAKTR